MGKTSYLITYSFCFMEDMGKMIKWYKPRKRIKNNICPHIINIKGEYYWVMKLRKEHPIWKGEEFRCHFCRRSYNKIKGYYERQDE